MTEQTQKEIKNHQQNQHQVTYVILEYFLSCFLHIQPCVVSSVNVPKHVRIRRLIVIALVTLAG